MARGRVTFRNAEFARWQARGGWLSSGPALLPAGWIEKLTEQRARPSPEVERLVREGRQALDALPPGPQQQAARVEAKRLERWLRALPAGVSPIHASICIDELAAKRDPVRMQDVLETLRALATAVTAGEPAVRLLGRLDDTCEALLQEASWQRFRQLSLYELSAPQLGQVALDARAQLLAQPRHRGGHPPRSALVLHLVHRALDAAPPGGKQRAVRDLLAALGIVVGERDLKRYAQHARTLLR